MGDYCSEFDCACVYVCVLLFGSIENQMLVEEVFDNNADYPIHHWCHWLLHCC